jgi:hypothetical protein
MMFYDVKERRKVEVKESAIKMEADKRGRKRAVATLPDGRKLYRYV